MISAEKAKASANPTKEFFVRMITRDITLEDCILDLVDNSVDGAWRCEGSRPMGLAVGANLTGYSISIIASPDHFSITDNCGGMTLDDAVEHAFSFGRRAIEEHDDYSIGVYGIGMKRAVFKLGADIRVRSTYKDQSGRRESFAVPIVVENWLTNDSPPWDFDITEDDALEEDGVEISIGLLTPGAVSSFSNPAFVQNLRRTIGRDYSLHLNRGLTISINGINVIGWTIELLQGDEFAPVRLTYLDRQGLDDVSVEIIAGMAAAPPEENDPAEDEDGDKRYGWYVACNGRIVLAADKSTISGWGIDGQQQWHYQYTGFIGIILFTAANAIALPLTTTKRSVDTTSEIFRRARPRMREAAQSWITYTNVRKQAKEEAKQKEAAAAPTPIYSLPPRPLVALPRLNARRADPVANVHYSVSLAKMKKLAREFGNINMTYRDAGIRSFDYAYDELVGED